MTPPTTTTTVPAGQDEAPGGSRPVQEVQRHQQPAERVLGSVRRCEERAEQVRELDPGQPPSSRRDEGKDQDLAERGEIKGLRFG